MKRILITGKNSYIGNSFAKWVEQWPDKYECEFISVRDDSWRQLDFSIYDTVFHVAGIAHVSNDKKLQDSYMKINRDLTIEIAEKAKSDGVNQFIFMSSIIIYGNSRSSNGIIDKNTIPIPNNIYGKSKLQAEEKLTELSSNEFNVAILRPPMIYGKNCKGNYVKLSKFAKYSPVFPDFNNKRSMLYIDNLCELVRLIVENEEKGFFFPQNQEYIKTSNLVKEIATVHGKKIITTRIFNPIIRILMPISIINKVFGDLTYDLTLSYYEKGDYELFDNSKSISITEGKYFERK